MQKMPFLLVLLWKDWLIVIGRVRRQKR